MRKKIVAGNWKMNTTLQEGLELASNINEWAKHHDPARAGIVIAPPLCHLVSVIQAVDFRKISVAAQNCAAWEKGAYTGEVSAEMIRSTGAHYVILGHSERRQYFGENNQTLATKINIALKNCIFPIYCCGEVLEQRQSGNHFAVVEQQINEGLFHLDEENLLRTVIAYEPVWAIGTGLTASPDQAQEMHAHIRKVIATKYGIVAADQIRILYGGSCNEKNAAELFACPDVDGGLIGGASLKAESFIRIIEAASV